MIPKNNSRTDEAQFDLWKKKDFSPKDIKIAYMNFKLFLKNKKNQNKPKLININ